MWRQQHPPETLMKFSDCFVLLKLIYKEQSTPANFQFGSTFPDFFATLTRSKYTQTLLHPPPYPLQLLRLNMAIDSINQYNITRSFHSSSFNVLVSYFPSTLPYFAFSLLFYLFFVFCFLFLLLLLLLFLIKFSSWKSNCVHLLLSAVIIKSISRLINVSFQLLLPLTNAIPLNSIPLYFIHIAV